MKYAVIIHLIILHEVPQQGVWFVSRLLSRPVHRLAFVMLLVANEAALSHGADGVWEIIDDPAEYWGLLS